MGIKLILLFLLFVPFALADEPDTFSASKNADGSYNLRIPASVIAQCGEQGGCMLISTQVMREAMNAHAEAMCSGQGAKGKTPKRKFYA